MQVKGERVLQRCVEVSKCVSQMDTVSFISQISIAMKYLIFCFLFSFQLNYKSIKMNVFTLQCGPPPVTVFCGHQGKQALAN